MYQSFTTLTVENSKSDVASRFRELRDEQGLTTNGLLEELLDEYDHND